MQCPSLVADVSQGRREYFDVAGARRRWRHMVEQGKRAATSVVDSAAL